MQINIRLGPGLAQHASSPRLQATVAENATVADVVAYLGERYPALEQPLTRAIPVVSGRHVTPSERLQEGQEVSLLFPIAGG